MIDKWNDSFDFKKKLFFFNLGEHGISQGPGGGKNQQKKSSYITFKGVIWCHLPLKTD